MMPTTSTTISMRLAEFKAVHRIAGKLRIAQVIAADKHQVIAAIESERGGQFVARVTVEEAYTAIQNGEAVVVDVRNLESYLTSHVAGAQVIIVTDVGLQSDDPHLRPAKGAAGSAGRGRIAAAILAEASETADEIGIIAARG